jgi:hypothetical protein
MTTGWGGSGHDKHEGGKASGSCQALLICKPNDIWHTVWSKLVVSRNTILASGFEEGTVI